VRGSYSDRRTLLHSELNVNNGSERQASEEMEKSFRTREKELWIV
jgi:hypothetical protein